MTHAPDLYAKYRLKAWAAFGAPCPVCGCPMHADVQPALVAGRADSTLYTCHTCYLTLDSRDLAGFDAAPYRLQANAVPVAWQGER